MRVRASDAEREATVERLRDAAAEGRLTLEELADRIEAASRAVTRGELAPLLSDLPSALPAARAPTSPPCATLGDVKRSGAWMVPAESRYRSWLGHIKLDLREARISEPEVHIHAWALFGTIDLLRPGGRRGRRPGAHQARAAQAGGRGRIHAGRTADRPDGRDRVRRDQGPPPAAVGEAGEAWPVTRALVDRRAVSLARRARRSRGPSDTTVVDPRRDVRARRRPGRDRGNAQAVDIARVNATAAVSA